MKKRVLSICLIAALAAVAVVGASLAYFTDTESKTDSYQLGSVEITLDASALDNSKVDKIQAAQVIMDTPITVKNVGQNEAWVRVTVTVDNANADKALDIDWGDAIAPATGDAVFTAVSGTAAGVYQYTAKLAAGDSVAAQTLIDSIKVKSELDFDTTQKYYLHGDGTATTPIGEIPEFNITVKADAIQTGFLGNDVTTAEKAFEIADAQTFTVPSGT